MCVTCVEQGGKGSYMSERRYNTRVRPLLHLVVIQATLHTCTCSIAGELLCLTLWARVAVSPALVAALPLVVAAANHGLAHGKRSLLRPALQGAATIASFFPSPLLPICGSPLVPSAMRALPECRYSGGPGDTAQADARWFTP